MSTARNMRILVVEDSAVLCRIAELKLAKLGLIVDIVNNGRDAIRAAQERDYDLILMDIHMPEMSGLEATRLIRKAQSKSGKRTPIIAVTASDHSDHCFEAGMDGYVRKPADYESIIRKWLPNALSKTG